MSNLITSTIPFLFTVIPLAAWIRSLNQLVPDPYLDEFFHIPQAQVYWRGNFSHWDDKITTPPGLYFFSYVWHSILARLPSQAPTKADLSTQDLRTDGFVIWLALQGTVWLYQRLERKSGRDVRWSSGGTRKSSSGKTWAILAFPLIFFFSGLYYTDVWSAVTVLATMCAWRASTQSRGVTRFMLQLLQVVLGLVSLGSRQTNVFWVVVFTGGLQAVETVSITTPIRNPSIDESSVEDYPYLLLSLLSNTLPALPQLLLTLWPQLTLLTAFTAFIVHNGSVVLGDKSNHRASLHLPQTLYLGPFLIFFSWPVLLPHLARPHILSTKLPRATTVCIAATLATCTVHFNTVIHPFLLADNRHYTFYVFKALRRRPWMFYAAVPVSLLCAWLAVIALGEPSSAGLSRQQKKQHQTSTTTTTTNANRTSDSTSQSHSTSTSTSTSPSPSESISTPTHPSKPSIQKQEQPKTRISFLLIWSLATALSLVTAPLVEPRYFLLPWLMWRLHVYSPPTLEVQDYTTTTAANKSKSESETARDEKTASASTSIKSLLLHISQHAVSVELAWYMLLNLVTCVVFLYRGFEWVQEPGRVQRFMW